jgi:polyvinyl alcohol dehydrogenase (cytochrome)
MKSKKLSVKLLFLAVGLFILNIAGATVFAQGGGANWPSAGSYLKNSRNAANESKISTTSVGNLQTKWIYNAKGEISATPTVEGNAVYLTDWGTPPVTVGNITTPASGGYIHRINAQTGAVVWSRNVSEYTGEAGALSRTSPAISGNTIVIGTQRRFFGGTAYVLAINKNTGELLWKTKADNHASAIVTQSPVIHGNRVYVGTASTEELLAAFDSTYQLTFRGSFAAYNLQTGEQVWKTYAVPEGYTGGGIWGSTAVVDTSRGSIYISTGNNYSVPASVQSCIDTARQTTYSTPGDLAAAEEACLAPNDYIDAVVSLDINTGAVKWGNRVEGADTWHVGCFPFFPFGIPCPDTLSPDYDFGSGPNMFRVRDSNGKSRDLVGAGQKSGVYWAFDADTGDIAWSTVVGPGSELGGIQWGSATDGDRIYVALSNQGNKPFTMKGGTPHNSGAFAALNPATGEIIWQVKAPQSPSGMDWGMGPLAVANGVVFGASYSGEMTALNAATGATLWNYNGFASQPLGSNISGASIANGTVYWETGYTNLGFGNTDNRLFAFTPSN